MRRSEAKNDWQLTVYIPRELRGEILSPSSGGWLASSGARSISPVRRTNLTRVGSIERSIGSEIL